jgi:hypothetical protein
MYIYDVCVCVAECKPREAKIIKIWQGSVGARHCCVCVFAEIESVVDEAYPMFHRHPSLAFSILSITPSSSFSPSVLPSFT